MARRRDGSPARARCRRVRQQRQLYELASSSSSSSRLVEGQRHDQRRGLDVRRAHLPAVGLEPEGPGLTLNYQAVGSGAGVTALRSRAPSTSPASDPALRPTTRSPARRRRAARRSRSRSSSARSPSPTTSPGVKSGPQARRQDDRRHLPRQGQEVERPRDRRRRTRARACPSTTITVVHRSDSSGTTKGFTQFLADYSPEWKSRPGRRQGRQVADRHRRQGQRRRRRGGQADRRRRRLRRAGLRAAEQLHLRGGEEQERQVRRADARVHLGRRRRPRVPADLAHHGHQLAEPDRLPDRLADVPRSSTRTSARPG